MLRAGLALALLASGPALAQKTPVPAPPHLEAESYILIDHASGREIAAMDADERLPPASLTKLMTAYIVFAALERGRIGLEDEVLVSEKAWRMPGSRTFIEVDTLVSVEDLVRGMIVQSGNDASVALAEHVAGSVESFVDLMNRRAAALGMNDTVYRNTTGLPARGHYSTARDSATLARAIIAEFPQYYGWYSEREFTYNGIRQYNRNRLLRRDGAVDGLKTGYTAAAGYCLVGSAERDGMRLISAVLGAENPRARADGSAALLDYGFRFYETRRLYASGERIAAARVWKGQPRSVGLGPADDLYVTIPRGQYEALTASLDLPGDLVAPMAAGVEIGRLKISLLGTTISSLPVISLHPVPEAGFLSRLKDEVVRWLE